MRLEQNLTVVGMGCQSTMRCANYCQFYSYWQCQKFCLMTFFLFIEKKCVYNPADLEVALTEIRGGTAKKGGSETVQYPKVHLTVSIK
jgi:hypothetical protein